MSLDTAEPLPELQQRFTPHRREGADDEVIPPAAMAAIRRMTSNLSSGFHCLICPMIFRQLFSLVQHQQRHFVEDKLIEKSRAHGEAVPTKVFLDEIKGESTELLLLIATHPRIHMFFYLFKSFYDSNSKRTPSSQFLPRRGGGVRRRHRGGPYGDSSPSMPQLQQDVLLRLLFGESLEKVPSQERLEKRRLLRSLRASVRLADDAHPASNRKTRNLAGIRPRQRRGKTTLRVLRQDIRRYFLVGELCSISPLIYDCSHTSGGNGFG